MLAAQLEGVERRTRAADDAEARNALTRRARLLRTRLEEPDGAAERDLTSGLPVDLLRAALAVDVNDPVLGPLPKTAAEARWEVWLAADGPARIAAARHRDQVDLEHVATNLKSHAAIAQDMRRVELSLVYEAFCAPVEDLGARRLRELWESGALNGLLRQALPAPVLAAMR